MDEDEWTLDDIHPLADNEGRVPSYEDTIRLMREYRATWTSSDGQPPTNLVTLNEWIFNRLNIPIGQVEWRVVRKAIEEERIKLMRLQEFAEFHHLVGDDRMMLYETANVLFCVGDIFKHSSRFLVNMSPSNMEARNWIAPEDIEKLDVDNENMFKHKEADNTNFQNAFFHFRQVLEGCRFRKAGGKFFKRIFLPGGVTANAYEEVCSVEDFVQDHSSYDSNFKVWRWLTNPTSNFKTMVEYLTERPIAEAPDLDENIYIRSYAGDENGVGSGVYNHSEDMFFPYDRVESWEQMAIDVQTVRRKLFDPNYKCTCPSVSEVGLVHLPCAFKDDIHAEVMAVDTSHLFLTWVEASDFECTHSRFYPDSDVSEESLALLLLSKAEETYSQTPIETVPRPRVRLTLEEWQELGIDGSSVTARSFVRTQCGRFFRVHTGSTWRDCPSPDIDHIYTCQDFVEHDIFFLYSVKGRVFFPVGERDNFEGTIFMEGTGGCGKSTIVKVYQTFWPYHRRGILSANIQTQFGMENVARGDVAWCTELSEEPNMPQEDWQDATGGHTVVCPIKHKQEPLIVHKWKAQFWWCSNVFPKRYKNRQCQVSRRLYGVAMYKPVRPRKDNMVEKISVNLGYVQRRSILAYQEWCMQQGNIDPMSSIDTLPPAFKTYYTKTRRETDPMDEFLSDGKFVVVRQGEMMPLSNFRTLYNEFRTHYDMGKAPRWCEDVYRTPFNERCIVVHKNVDIVWEGEPLNNVDVVVGVAPYTG